MRIKSFVFVILITFFAGCSLFPVNVPISFNANSTNTINNSNSLNQNPARGQNILSAYFDPVMFLNSQNKDTYNTKYSKYQKFNIKLRYLLNQLRVASNLDECKPKHHSTDTYDVYLCISHAQDKLDDIMYKIKDMIQFSSIRDIPTLIIDIENKSNKISKNTYLTINRDNVYILNSHNDNKIQNIEKFNRKIKLGDIEGKSKIVLYVQLDSYSYKDIIIHINNSNGESLKLTSQNKLFKTILPD